MYTYVSVKRYKNMVFSPNEISNEITCNVVGVQKFINITFRILNNIGSSFYCISISVNYV